MMRRIHIVGFLIGAVAIAALVWFVCRPREIDPVTVYKITPINTLKNTGAAADRGVSTRRGMDSDRRSDGTSHQNRHADAPATEMSVEERLQAAMASPAYEAYTRKQAERLGFNVVLWWEFLEAAGITHNGRILQAAAFEKHFPDGGSYADYEPMMELEVAEMFLEDPSQSVMDVLQRFNATQSNRVWRFGYFNGYEGEYEWGQRIQRDAVDIVVNGIRQHDTFEGSPSPSVPESLATEGFSTDVGAAVRPPDPSGIPAEMPSFAESETLPESFEALETQFFQGLEADVPAFPTDARLETQLRERFSPDRFSTATQTLRRYGPEEGLRRLKASDPEVATHIERFLRREDTPTD